MNMKMGTALAASVVLLTGTAALQGQAMTRVSGTEERRMVLLRDDSAPDAAGQPADPQAKDDLLEGLERIGVNAKERNEVNLDKSVMALAHRTDLSNKMDMITVRNYEFAARGQYNKSDLDALRHKLEGAGWSHLVRNESDGETNDIVVRTGADGLISDMVILNAEPREVNVVHLRGHFKMEDVNGAMGSAMGMGGGMFGMAGAMGHMGGGPTSYTSSHTSTRASTGAAPSPVPAPAPPAAPPQR